MWSLLDIVLLVVSHRHKCVQCGAAFWCESSPPRGELSVGRECYICHCGARYDIGNREWIHLTEDERRRYLWSGTLAIPAVTTVLASILGYFLRWHEPYWFMAVFLGFLGLITGLICSSFLWIKRGLRIWASRRRTRDAAPSQMAVLH